MSRLALIGSLRSRIVVVILLMTVAVQLAIYTVVDNSNQKFQQAHKASIANHVAEITSAVVSAEFQLLDYELLRASNELRKLARSNNNVAENQLIALVDKHNTSYLSVGNRHLILRNNDSSILYTGHGQAQNIPALTVPPAADTMMHSGYYDENSAFLTATAEVEAGNEKYFLSMASNVKLNILPSIEKLSQVSAKVVRLSEATASENIEHSQIAGFPEARIEGVSQDSNELNKLIGSQKSQLQVLLASSLIVVLFLGMALARELTKPLKLLVQATRKIKNGDYSVQVPMLHRDEIGELAETIDLMREHVGEREDEILKLAYADTLTSLPNRALFDDRLNTAVAIGQRRGDMFAVVVLDMDRFKYINDVLGHESGDAVLKEVADRLTTILRDSDTVARLGGDEFALLLQDVSSHEEIMTAVDRITSVFAKPVTLNNQPIDIGCSIGIAGFPQHGTDASTLLRRADMAMYSAKRSDTDYAFYDPNCEEHREEHLSLLSEIKRAIEFDELQLFYQPKVTLDDSSAFSVETLLRWQHPNRGLIPPVEFIPFAEQTGAIRLITRWVVAAAMTQARDWADRGLVIKLSLNISARDLLDSDFSDFVSSHLKESGVDPSMICMEITESALMEDPIKARRTVQELHNLGLSLSIDDYGTGYSSLAYVKNLPVNELKIDREFIKNMIDNKEDVAIVRSTIELGHNLGLKVVAEGIEHEEEMQMLKEFGCDQAQGFLISKALTATDIETWISNNGPSSTAAEYSGIKDQKKAG